MPPPPVSVVPPEFDYDDKEPWAADSYMVIPIESTQVLMPESAAILGVQAFLKMVNLPITIKEMYNATSMSPNGKVPVIKSGPYVVAEMEGVTQLAFAKGAVLGENLNAAEKADLRAYMSLVHNVLGNAMLYFCWVDEFIYNHLTKHRCASPFKFPLSYLYPWKKRSTICSQLDALKWGKRTPEEVYKEVETCLQALSERLGEGEYFFGTTQTELDALVFGYLFTMITTPLPNSNQLGNLVKQQPSLVRFCQRLEKNLFGTKE
jgi:metaxin